MDTTDTMGIGGTTEETTAAITIQRIVTITGRTGDGTATETIFTIPTLTGMVATTDPTALVSTSASEFGTDREWIHR